MIGSEDVPYTYEYESYYKILPSLNKWNEDVNRIKQGIKVPEDFIYRSDTNDKWMSSEELRNWVEEKYDQKNNPVWEP